MKNTGKGVLRIGLLLFYLLINCNTTECFVSKLVSDQISHPHKTTGKRTVLIIANLIFNKLYIGNNNLLQNSPFGRLSR